MGTWMPPMSMSLLARPRVPFEFTHSDFAPSATASYCAILAMPRRNDASTAASAVSGGKPLSASSMSLSVATPGGNDLMACVLRSRVYSLRSCVKPSWLPVRFFIFSENDVPKPLPPPADSMRLARSSMRPAACSEPTAATAASLTILAALASSVVPFWFSSKSFSSTSDCNLSRSSFRRSLSSTSLLERSTIWLSRLRMLAAVFVFSSARRVGVLAVISSSLVAPASAVRISPGAFSALIEASSTLSPPGSPAMLMPAIFSAEVGSFSASCAATS